MKISYIKNLVKKIEVVRNYNFNRTHGKIAGIERVNVPIFDIGQRGKLRRSGIFVVPSAQMILKPR
jgi:hypothetical protein